MHTVVSYNIIRHAHYIELRIIVTYIYTYVASYVNKAFQWRHIAPIHNHKELWNLFIFCSVNVDKKPFLSHLKIKGIQEAT